MLVSFHFFEIFFREPVAEQGSVTDIQRYVDGDPLTSNASSLRKPVESPQRFYSPCNLFDTGMHSTATDISASGRGANVTTHLTRRRPSHQYARTYPSRGQPLINPEKRINLHAQF